MNSRWHRYPIPTGCFYIQIAASVSMLRRKIFRVRTACAGLPAHPSPNTAMGARLRSAGSLWMDAVLGYQARGSFIGRRYAWRDHGLSGSLALRDGKIESEDLGEQIFLWVKPVGGEDGGI